MLKALTDVPLEKNDLDLNATALNEAPKRSQASSDANRSCSLVLAGLHACGDLSVTMLRTFMECKEVKAVVSIGCCYNLLSEKTSEDAGFPMSTCLKSLGCSLSKNARNLACQSAERWSSLGLDAGLLNFELHSFRAAFQMVLWKHYPEVLATSPSIGRQGKAFRSQKQSKALEAPATVDTSRKDTNDKRSMTHTSSCFEKFCLSALSSLNLEHPQDLDLSATWDEASAFTELIGPYWSIRASLGPVVETLILLDRVMFLQEQGDCIEVEMLPIFDPTISPRNVAIIAKRR